MNIKIKRDSLALLYNQKYLEHEGIFCCFWVQKNTPKNTKFIEGNEFG